MGDSFVASASRPARTNLTPAQRAALQWFAEAKNGRNWTLVSRHLHDWTFGSLVNRGLIECWNCPYRDEVWDLTDEGRQALADATNKKEPS